MRPLEKQATLSKDVVDRNSAGRADLNFLTLLDHKAGVILAINRFDAFYFLIWANKLACFHL